MKTAIAYLSSSTTMELSDNLTNSFLTYLRTRGYAERTLCKKKICHSIILKMDNGKAVHRG